MTGAKVAESVIMRCRRRFRIDDCHCVRYDRADTGLVCIVDS